MPSSSINEPCSTDRTPARIATLIPSAPWAWAATKTPCAAASSTAARTVGSSSSTTSGFVPRVRTGDDELDQVGAAGDELADLLAGVGGRPDDPEPQVRRQGDVAGQAGHLATAAGRGDVGAGALHSRASQPARVDRVAQRDVDERAIRADVANRREPGVERGPGVADAGHRLLGGARRGRGHACELHVADQVAVAVDEPGQDGEAGQVEDADAVGGRLAVAEDRLDRAVGDEKLPLAQDLARIDVDDPRAADDERVGHGGRCYQPPLAMIGPCPTSRSSRSPATTRPTGCSSTSRSRC
jgi:hypothetical protein